MQRYIIRRMLLVIPTLLLVSVIVFSVIRLIPGDVVLVMTQDYQLASDIEDMRERLGLNQPIHVQYFEWVNGFPTGEFGRSLYTGNSALSQIWHRFPVTLELAVFSLLISAVFGISLGVYSAVRQDTWLDYAGRSVSIFFLSAPNFFVATLILLLPAYYLGWAPHLTWIPFTQDPLGNLQQVLLPAAIIGAASAASLMRLTRAMMLEEMRQDYVRTALAKGLQERTVIYRHALKNAMIPVLTLFGLRIPTALGGAVIIEVIFGFPGLGRWITDSIIDRDYPLLQAAVLFLAVIVLLTNLLIDILYAWFNPRIRYS